MNNEEAERALAIAQRHESTQNYSAALRFARKAVSLSSGSLVPASLLVDKLELLSSSSASASASTSSTPAPTASTSGANPHASTSRPIPRSSANPTEKKREEEKPKREYTKSQVDLVKKVKSCRSTDYYGILGLEKGCDDSAVKKAYRKLALGLHPDKCGAPGAEEAFKYVSKAFQILSDPNKRAVYDQTGSDPDSRGGGGGGGGGGGFSPAFARGSPFGGGGDEISPEDLFNMFFGGGMGGMGGPGMMGGGTTFFGPGGMRFQSMNGGGRPRQAGAAGGQQQASGWVQLLPLLVLVAFSILTQLPGLFGSTPVPDPDFAFSQTPRYSARQETSSSGVAYFVNPKQFSSHPMYNALLSSNPSIEFKSKHEPGSSSHSNDLYQHFLSHPLSGRISNPTSSSSSEKLTIPKELRNFERTIERSWIHRLQQFCQREIDERQNALQRARGFFGIGADWKEVKEITDARLEHCEKLAGLGYTVQY